MKCADCRQRPTWDGEPVCRLCFTERRKARKAKLMQPSKGWIRHSRKKIYV